MANVLTNLFPDLYKALDTISRELVGFIPAVSRDSTAERGAVGQNTRSHVVGVANVSDITPSMTVPEPTDQTVGNIPITITKSRAAEFGFVGEEQRGLKTGAGYMSIQANMILQSMRALTNEVENDLAAEARLVSRAYGTAGTAPFSSDLTDSAHPLRLLMDNGSPTSDLQLVINTTAGANMRTLSNLTRANEANDATLLRQGVLLDLHGFAIRESAAIKPVTKGTGTSYTTNTTGYSEGDTVITLITGTGTVLAGDVVTFAGDDNKYIVAVGTAAAGPITLALPGLREDIASSAVAMTIGNDFSANVAFDRGAIHLATRTPELPQEGDLAIDRAMITDDRSGLTFEVSVYPGHRKVRFEIAIAWGVKTVKAEHGIVLLG